MNINGLLSEFLYTYIVIWKIITRNLFGYLWFLNLPIDDKYSLQVIKGSENMLFTQRFIG